MSNQSRKKMVLKSGRSRDNAPFPLRQRKKGNNGEKYLLQGQDIPSIDFDKEMSSSLSFRGLVVPDHYYTHLSYGTPATILIAATSSGQRLYAGNSCYDPDITLTGHQPMGFDELSALYARYRVHKSLCRVEVERPTDSAMISVTASLNSTTPGTVTAAMECPYTKILTISSSVFQSGCQVEISTKKLWGVPSIIDDDFTGLVTTDPVNLWYWIVNGRSYDNSTAITLYVNTWVIYHVEFYDRKSLGQS